MPRYMSKQEMKDMKADLERRKAASQRRAVGKAAMDARPKPKEPTKRYDKMTAEEKAAYRKKMGRDKTLKEAQAKGDAYRKRMASKNKPATSTSTPTPPKPGEKGYRPKGAAAQMNRTAEQKAADAAAAAAETSRRNQRRQEYSDKVQAGKDARAAERRNKAGSGSNTKGRRSGSYVG